MPKKPPRWYFSFRSPYSWLAYRDLVEHYPDVADAVEWLPFWEPDATSERMLTEAGGSFAYVPMSKEKHRYILQDLRRLATARGLAFRWPVDTQPHWEVAHLGYLAARRDGAGAEFIAEVYRCRWERGQDISAPEVIADAAARVGLDGERIATAERDPEIRREGRDVLLSVYRDDVFGVPFFIHGYDKYWGVDRLPGFVEAVRGASARHEPPGTGPRASDDEDVDDVDDSEDTAAMSAHLVAADGGHAGGCG